MAALAPRLPLLFSGVCPGVLNGDRTPLASLPCSFFAPSNGLSRYIVLMGLSPIVVTVNGKRQWQASMASVTHAGASTLACAKVVLCALVQAEPGTPQDAPDGYAPRNRTYGAKLPPRAPLPVPPCLVLWLCSTRLQTTQKPGSHIDTHPNTQPISLALYQLAAKCMCAAAALAQCDYCCCWCNEKRHSMHQGYVGSGRLWHAESVTSATHIHTLHPPLGAA